MFDVIAFDADDTLWHNEYLYTRTSEAYLEMLSAYGSRDEIERKLYQTEIDNLTSYGYGIKSFALSMIETAIDVTDGEIQGHEIQQILDHTRRMLAAPVDLLDGVRETLHTLHEQGHTLMVITKGDLLDQESKVARSGLADFFTYVEVLSEKTPAAYAAVLASRGIDPARVLMIGNSLKSDVLPVVEIGGTGVHIPYHTTWEHETVSAELAERADYYELADIREVPALLACLREESTPCP